MKCRHCASELALTMVDLGFAPPSNAYLDAEALHRPETSFPLRVKVCQQCWLVQTEDYAKAEALFTHDYAYFSSTSKSWVDHARRYSEMIIGRLGLGADSHVIEIAANDGYLLQHFMAAKIPCLGIEPTHSTAEAARALSIPVLEAFFGEALAKQLCEKGQQADLLIGNNVFAHVPDINDFTRGLKTALKAGGTITLEFPHLLELLRHGQFDTIYHEHFSYLSLLAVQRIFTAAGLRIFDVEKLPTHGGSLRIYGCHQQDSRPTLARVEQILAEEKAHGLDAPEVYAAFQARADAIKNALLGFLLAEKQAGRKVVAYGAAAKGNTLLNYAGVKPDLLPVVFDAAPSKQGQYLPGSHIPIAAPSSLAQSAPDTVLVLPWNLAQEIRSQLQAELPASTRFVVAVPKLASL